MKRLVILILLFAAIKVAGQTTGYLRFDTVKIMKQNGTCELYIINKTKDSLGLLTNIGGGLTRFIKPLLLNDSTIRIGVDTITIRGNSALFDLLSTRVAFGDINNNITDDADFTYNSTTNQLTAGHAVIGSNIPSTNYAGIGSKSAFGNHAPVISLYNPNAPPAARRWEINLGDPNFGVDTSLFVSLYNDAGTTATFPIIFTRSGDRLVKSLFVTDRFEINGHLDVYGEGFFNDSLRVNTLRTGTATDSAVVIDPLTRAFKKIAQSDMSTGVTASNGLTKTGSNITLGGLLDQTTTINFNGNQLRYTNIPLSRNLYSGRIVQDRTNGSIGFRNQLVDTFVSNQYALTWTAVNTPANQIWGNLTWSPELRRLVAVSHSASTTNVMTSDNGGLSWDLQTTPNTNALRGIAWSPKLKLFVAVASTGSLNRVSKSTDGKIWTAVTTPSPDRFWRDVIWVEELSLFVAVANTAGVTDKVMTSPDGDNWTYRTCPDRPWSDIVWSPELQLLCVSATGLGTNSKFMTSPDAITWTDHTSPGDSASWEGITWSGDLGLFIAVSYSCPSCNVNRGKNVQTSPDGTTWTLRNTPASPLRNPWQNMLSVAWSPEFGMAAAVIDDDSAGYSVMTSANATNWTLQQLPTIRDMRRIIWVRELGSFIALAYHDGTTTGDSLVFVGRTLDDRQQYLNIYGRSFAQRIQGKVTFWDTLQAPNAILKTDTTNFKPAIFDANGNLFKSTYWYGDGTGGGGGGTPGGSNTQLQYNDAGSFGGTAGATWDNTNTGLSITKTGLGVTQNNSSGFLAINPTLAAAGAQQISPPSIWEGQGWKTTATAASQPVRFRVHVLPVQGTSAPTGNYIIGSSINSGAYTDLVTVTSAGAMTVLSTLTTFSSLTLGAANLLSFGARSVITSPTNGSLRLTNSSQSDFSILNFGPATSSFFGIKRSGVNAQIRLGDDSDYSDLEVKDEAYDATGYNGSLEVVTKNAFRDKIESLNIVQGTYTPTLTNGANVAASSIPGTTLYYKREGNQVTVWGMVEIDPTAATTATVLSLSLPIASALTTYTQLSGQGAGNSIAGAYFGGFIQGDDTNDRAQLDFTSGTSLAQVWSIRFSYEIL
jgi:hypothetical protein